MKNEWFTKDGLPVEGTLKEAKENKWFPSIANVMSPILRERNAEFEEKEEQVRNALMQWAFPFSSNPMPDDIRVNGAAEWIRNWFRIKETNEAIINETYGGVIPFIGERNSEIYILDIRLQAWDGAQPPKRPEDRIWMGALRKLYIEKHLNLVGNLVTLYIHPKTGKTYAREWEHPQTLEESFMGLYKAWCVMRSYYPHLGEVEE